MNENLDLTKILKDCPKGTKFYSRFLGSVEFCKITLDNYIEVIGKNGYYIGFKPNGIYQHSEENAEIDLFPSKDQRDWSKWHRPFVDGDIVTDIEGAVIIYREITTCGYCGSFASLDHRNQFIPHYKAYLDYIRFATEEEKQKLFKAIQENGYKWNQETKTLEELIVPKFKIGDIIKDKSNLKWKVIDVNSHYYEVSLVLTGISKLLEIKAQDDYELAPNKFDPKTLQPFESRVLVSTFGKWMPAIFGNYNKGYTIPIVVVGGNVYTKCIPYEGNEHLLGTNDEPSEFYRYWEE